MRSLILKIVVLSFLCVVKLFAQKGFETKEVTIFSDKYSVFIKQGDIALTENSYLISPLPKVRYGTLQVFSGNEYPSSMIAYRDTVVIKKIYKNFERLIESNVGKKISTGKAYGSIKGIVNFGDRKFIALQSYGETTLTDVKDVKQIKFESATNIDEQTTTFMPAMNVTFTNNTQRKPITISYLRDGLSWKPIYKLELNSKKQLTLYCDAQISNDAEDLKDVSVDIIVGLPDFKYAYKTSILINFRQQRIQNNYSINKDTEISMVRKTQNSKQKLQEFYRYNLPKINLKKGERASFNLAKEILDYTPLYECDIAKTSTFRNVPDTYSSSDVYYSLKIKNNTDKIFSSGAVMVIDTQSDKRYVLGQNTFPFLSKNLEGNIRVSKSPQIKVYAMDIATGGASQMNFNNSKYKKEEIKGLIRVINNKKEDIKMEITKVILGEVIDADFDILYQSQYPNSLNKNTKSRWLVEVKSGGIKEIEYKYTHYTKL